MEGHGFSLVEVLSPCPTNWKMEPVESWKWIDEVMAKGFPLGVLKDATGEKQRCSLRPFFLDLAGRG